MAAPRALFLAWLIALVASGVVLFVGEVMGQAPCILCWFQRAFMFPLVVVLGVAVYRGDVGVWRYGLALSVVGLLVAAYHVALFTGLVPEAAKPCTATGPSCTGDEMWIAGIVPIPLLSLAGFGSLIALMLIVRKGSRS